MYASMIILGAFVLVYSIVAARIERTWISGPIVFVSFGFLIGPSGLGVLDLETDAETLRALAELTLALVLFTDAASTDFKVLRRAEQLPARLLGIGLPFTILLGMGVGAVVFRDFTWLEIALLATMLAPTDAALGTAVIANPAVPASTREGLNIESGLNDGICVPLILLLLALAAGSEAAARPWHSALVFFGEAVGIGVGTGVILTGVTVLLLKLAMRYGWLSPVWKKITFIALAFTCFGTSQVLGGSGFIACFVGGLVFARLLRPQHEHLLIAAEGIGDTLALLTWVAFGAAVLGPAVAQFSWLILLYGLLSLTLVRMLPVFVSLLGLGESTESKLFIGWFGPRGLASIVFAVIVIGAELPHGDTLSTTVAWTVLLSILLHGVTATPWARAYGERARRPTG